MNITKQETYTRLLVFTVLEMFILGIIIILYTFCNCEYCSLGTIIISIWNMVIVVVSSLIFLWGLDTKCIIKLCQFIIIIGMIFQFLNIGQSIYWVFIIYNNINNQTQETSSNLIKEIFTYRLLPDVINLFAYTGSCIQIRKIYLKSSYAVAVHEAGHAVISLVLLPCLEIEKIHSRGFRGDVKYFKYDGNVEEARSFISVYYSGKIAVESILKIEPDGFEQDMKYAVELTEQIIKEHDNNSNSLTLNGEEIRQKASNRAQELVEIHKQKILEVAKALMKKRTLYGEEVQKILMKN